MSRRKRRRPAGRWLLMLAHDDGRRVSGGIGTIAETVLRAAVAAKEKK